MSDLLLAVTIIVLLISIPLGSIIRNIYLLRKYKKGNK